MSSAPADPVSPRLRVLPAIVLGGFACGVLDITEAFVFWGVRTGASPARILQSVAAGVLGRDAAVQGGLATAALGAVLHFFIATTAAAVYVLASLKLPVLVRHAVPCGLLYGVAVHFFMTYVVIPLSAIGGGRGGAFNLALFLNGVIGHALFVGLPISLATRWAAGPRAGRSGGA
jgi:hypothetical protein